MPEIVTLFRSRVRKEVLDEYVPLELLLGVQDPDLRGAAGKRLQALSGE